MPLLQKPPQSWTRQIPTRWRTQGLRSVLLPAPGQVLICDFHLFPSSAPQPHNCCKCLRLWDQEEGVRALSPSPGKVWALCPRGQPLNLVDSSCSLQSHFLGNSRDPRGGPQRMRGLGNALSMGTVTIPIPGYPERRAGPEDASS